MGKSIGGTLEVLLVKLREQIVSGDVAGALRNGDEQFTFGFVKAFRFHKSLAEKGVKAGLKVEQAQRFNGGSHGFIESAGAKMNACELRVYKGIFAIVIEGGFEQHTRFVHFSEFDERAGDALAEIVVDGFGSSNFFEKWASFSGTFFEQELAGEEPFDEQRTAMGKFAQLAFFEMGATFGGRVFLFRLLGTFLGITSSEFSFRFGLIFFDALSKFFDNRTTTLDLAKRGEAVDQEDAETMFFRPVGPQFFSEGRSFAAAVSIAVSASEIIFEFADALVDVFLFVRARRGDIAEFDKLFEGFGGSDRIQLRFRRMRSGIAGDFVPGFDRFDEWRFFECG
jgi:hypothetical protein